MRWTPQHSDMVLAMEEHPAARQTLLLELEAFVSDPTNKGADMSYKATEVMRLLLVTGRLLRRG